MIKKITLNLLVLSTLVSSLNAASEELIKKGKQLAIVGDCYACHTNTNGQQYGGGVSFPTPFGIIYSKNISSDKENGIGSYSYEEFSKTIREGISKRGNLYPAMPYDSFHLITDNDTKALYEYFKTIPAVSQKNKEDEVSFPFNIRTGLKVWNFVNLSNDTFQVNSEKSDTYNRGSYLINSVGHCASCHTPRNLTMGLDRNKHLEGNLIAGVMAPNITSEEFKRQDWTHEDIISILKNGYSKKGTVLGHMTPIIYHSLSKLNDTDLYAMASYLLNSDKKEVAKVLTFNEHDKKDPGYKLYSGYCASCHGINGQGIPNTVPAMAGNGTLNQLKPLNTIYTLVYGIQKQRYSQNNSFAEMPSYKFDDEQLTQIVNYLHKTFTNSDKTYSKKQIIEFKKEVIKGAKE